MHTEETLVRIFEAVFNSVNDGIIVTDGKGKIILYNLELAKLEELEHTDVIGKNLSEVYNNVTVENSQHLSVIETGKPILDLRKTYFTNQGKEVNIVASTYPIYQDGKPVAAYSVCKNITHIKELLARNLELQEQIRRNPGDSGRNGTRYSFDSVKFASGTMQSLLSSAKKAAESDCSILVFGETGTGKELLVQGIHNYSGRREYPFVAINCAAIPETLLESILFGTAKGAFTGAVESKGLFEQAGKGTVFLDEVNSMSINLQAKLLRVLQEKAVRRVGGVIELPTRCRVISTTNSDPLECISKGNLRKDLFYRLAVITLYLPPLRDRKDDISALLNYFLKHQQRIYGLKSVQISLELKQILSEYQWPGNVRELEHIVESTLSMLGEEREITIDHLPPYLKSKFQATRPGMRYSVDNTLSSVLKEVEKQVLQETMRKYRGNVTRAAGALGIARQNLQYRLRKLGINLNISN